VEREGSILKLSTLVVLLGPKLGGEEESGATSAYSLSQSPMGDWVKRKRGKRRACGRKA